MGKSAGKLERGVSLLEALVVVALIGTILLVALPSFFRMLQTYRTQTAVSQLAMNLRFSRNAAVKQKVKYQIRVNRNSDSPSNRYFVEYDPSGTSTFVVVPHVDVSYDLGASCSCVKMPEKIKILDSTTATTILFSSRGGASGSGDILIQGLDGSQYRIRVSTVGGVETTKLS